MIEWGRKVHALVVGLAAFLAGANEPLSAQNNLNQGLSAAECADALPVFADTCPTLVAFLQRSVDGFGAGGASRQVVSELMFEPRMPPDPDRLDLLPLLRWNSRATGFATSLPRGTCWLEGAAGTVLRCVFDFASDGARAEERYQGLKSVLHAIAAVEWNYTSSPRSVLFSDGKIVRVSLHLVNFDAPDWIADSRNSRWRVLLSFGALGAHDEAAKAGWVKP